MDLVVIVTETKMRLNIDIMTCYQMKQSFLQNDNAFIDETKTCLLLSSVLLISQHKTLIKLGSKNVTK